MTSGGTTQLTKSLEILRSWAVAVRRALRSFLAKHLGRVVVGLLLLVVLGVSLALWIPSRAGSKHADLGSALLSGVVVGVVVLLVEVSFTRDANRRDVDRSLATTGPPATDDGLPTEASVPAAAEPIAAEAVVRPRVEGAGRFRVEYEGTIRDTSRIDANEVRLRVFSGDDDYFQFVTVIVPGPELRAALGVEPHTTVGQLWRSIATEACRKIEDAIRTREIPKDDPQNAFEIIMIDLRPAVRKARYAQEISAGDTVCEFPIS